MTSQSSGGGSIDAPFGRSSTRPVTEVYHQPARSFPQQSAIPSLPASTNGARNSEPASKRQKVEEHPSTVNIQEPRDNISKNPAQQASGLQTILSPADVTDNSQPPKNKNKATRATACPFLPVRPCHDLHRRGAKQKGTIETGKSSIRKEVQTKPYIPESPPSAPKYRKDGPADYNPWTGTHPEDTLNESTTRQGFYDKIQISQNESSTARPSVWSSLKHKSGLQILSSLFVSALDQRQNYGTVAANCTFKPPPRVTLTDTKREGWLRDLADASIPLRRLSRTIPHGIRGKSLLDQCLAKDIPITRAVWLAKCVGANEIRAFKRKGASGAFAIGGEDKWIRDWTTNVEAFVESVVDECGTPDWRQRIHYSLRVVTHLFSEHLLDREHYLNWVISSLQNCNLDSIPIWLLIAKIYWKEILRYRQRGKRLAETLLEQLSKASESHNRSIYAAVCHELAEFSRSVLKAAPACFILPFCWSKYETLLRRVFEEDGSAADSDLEQVSQRNLRLIKASLDTRRSSTHISEQRLIVLLDKVSFSVDIGDFADTCLSAANDQTLLITICLNWATSLTRFGHARIYLVIRLFRRWAKLNIDLERPILDFLASNPDLTPLQKANVYKLLAELVHSKNLSIGRYLQWLMAKEDVIGRKNTNGTYPSDLQWLFELPLSGLPHPTLNLRQILISSIGGYAKEEIDNIAAIKAKIADQIPEIFAPHQCLAKGDWEHSKNVYVSQTVKSAVGRWIRKAVASFFLPQIMEDEGSNPRPDEIERHSPSVASLEQFRTIRNILETFEDFPILADVVKIFSDSNDVVVLAAATDTVNHHFEVFSAIGAIHDLFESLHQQHENICGQKASEKPFVESLVDLGHRLRRSVREVHKLWGELVLCKQKHPAAACSPISDSMADSLQPAEPCFVDEVEQVLVSGTIMEKHTLIKIFETIAQRIRMSWQGTVVDNPLIDFPELFIRLRAFDSDMFQSLVQDWLDGLLLLKDRPSLLKILPPFICANTISLTTVLERTTYFLDTIGHESNVTALCIEALELIAMKELDLPSFTTYKEYRFYLQQSQVIQESSSLIIPIFQAMIGACKNAEIQLSERARMFAKSVGSRSIVQGLMQQQSKDPDAIVHILEIGLCLHEVQMVIDGILFSSERPALTELTLHRELLKLFIDVNILSAPLCRLKLKAILAAATQSDHKVAGTIISIFKDKAETDNSSVMNVWIILLSGLPSDHASQICEAAEIELFSYLPKFVGLSLGRCKGILYAMIAIIGATAGSISDSAASVVIAQITEKMMSLLSAPKFTEDRKIRESVLYNAGETLMDNLSIYIDILLRLLTIHCSAVQISKHSENSLVSLLVALSLLLIHPSLASRPELAEHVFDVLILVVDSIPDEARSQCIRILRDQHRSRDPRLLFIFGFSEKIDTEWLQMSTTSYLPSATKGEETKVTTATTTTTTPFTLRKWEMMPDATPLLTENDTSLSLTLFATKKAVL